VKDALRHGGYKLPSPIQINIKKKEITA
jgi:ribosomal protein L16/L10AE